MKRLILTLAAILVVTAGLFRALCGFYTIQPIGALPEGRTIVVWRGEGEPFFNSPDAECIARMGGVSLMCRLAAMGNAPVDRIVARLPYSERAYLLSTGGKTFGQ